MTNWTTRRAALAAALGAAALAAPAARAADGGAAELPPLGKPPRTAAMILADAVKAVGTEAAWKAHRTVRMKLEMSFMGMGINGSAERFSTKEDKALLVTDMPGMGAARQGTNGKVFWSQDPINGMRRLTGAEADWAHIEAAWNPELRTDELYKSVEVKPDPTRPDLECLLLTPREAPAVTDCYDAKTHLQVSQQGTEPTPQGDTPFSSTLKDWREVGGLKVPFAVETRAGPITFTARLVDVKFDEPMSAKMFEPPGGAAAEAEATTEAAPKSKGKAKSGSKAPRAKKP
jgi:hypothetical protein